MSATARQLGEVQDAMTKLGKAAATKLRELHAEQARIDADWRIDAVGKKQGREEAWRRFDETFAHPAQNEMRALRREYDTMLAELTASHRQPTGVEAEMLRTAAWSRMQAALDAVPAGQVKVFAAHKMLEQAAATEDMATLQAARRELDPYLARHNESMQPEQRAMLNRLAGTPDTIAAQIIHDTGEQPMELAHLALQWSNKAVNDRAIPSFIPFPSNVEDEKIATIIEAA